MSGPLINYSTVDIGFARCVWNWVSRTICGAQAGAFEVSKNHYFTIKSLGDGVCLYVRKLTKKHKAVRVHVHVELGIWQVETLTNYNL